jgi:hypothetical protein
MVPLPPLPPAVEQALFAQSPAGQLPYYWHLPVLLVIISLVYSATRFDDWPHILREALRWGLRLLVFLMVIVVLLYLAAEII